MIFRFYEIGFAFGNKLSFGTSNLQHSVVQAQLNHFHEPPLRLESPAKNNRTFRICNMDFTKLSPTEILDLAKPCKEYEEVSLLS